MSREATAVCLRVLKNATKYSYCVRNSVLIVYHITFRVQFFPTTFLEIAKKKHSERQNTYNTVFLIVFFFHPFRFIFFFDCCINHILYTRE